MLNLIAFWWMVVMAILKLTGVVVCSWWLIFGPMIVMVFATIIFLSYVHMLMGGNGKFWK